MAAARGSILDRYGRVLVSNTSCNNLVFNPDDLFEQDDPNGILLKMARTVVSCGDTYVDELPVTTAPPFEYTDMSETQRTQLKGFLKYAGLDEEATAVELLSYCREKFEINNNYSAADMRTIAGLRYSIKTRYIDKLYLPDIEDEYGVRERLLRLAEEGHLDVVAALLSGDRKTFEALRCEAPELVHAPVATYDWYVQHYLDRDYPIRLIMRLNGVKFPD